MIGVYHKVTRENRRMLALRYGWPFGCSLNSQGIDEYHINTPDHRAYVGDYIVLSGKTVKVMTETEFKALKAKKGKRHVA